MADTPMGPGWWQASDLQWYPPEKHPDYKPPVVATPAPEPAPAPVPTPAPVAEHPPGWWQASDLQWYPPEKHPNYKPPAVPAAPSPPSFLEHSGSMGSLTSFQHATDTHIALSDATTEIPAVPHTTSTHSLIDKTEHSRSRRSSTIIKIAVVVVLVLVAIVVLGLLHKKSHVINSHTALRISPTRQFVIRMTTPITTKHQTVADGFGVVHAVDYCSTGSNPSVLYAVSNVSFSSNSAAVTYINSLGSPFSIGTDNGEPDATAAGQDVMEAIDTTFSACSTLKAFPNAVQFIIQDVIHGSHMYSIAAISTQSPVPGGRTFVNSFALH